MTTNYPDTHLFLNGEWREAVAKESLEIINPATEEVIGKVSHARKEDLDIALSERKNAFDVQNYKKKCKNTYCHTSFCELQNHLAQRVLHIFSF